MATLKREVKKLPSESNLRLLSSLIVSIANKQSSLEDRVIAPWKADETYQKDISYVSHNGYVYICSVTNQDSVFTESHWTKLADNITELTKDDISALINLSPEEISKLSDLISTEIRLDKVFSSSDTYMRIQAAIDTAKEYTNKQLGNAVKPAYKVVASTSEVTETGYFYLISNGTNFDMYVLSADGSVVSLGTSDVDLSNYYTKTELDSDFLKKTDADGKYATITTVDAHINDTVAHMTQDEKDSYALKNETVKKTDIATTISGTPSDEKVASEKAVSDVVSDTVPFKFGIDDKGNYGYYKAGADTVTPFRVEPTQFATGVIANLGSESITIDISKRYLVSASLKYTEPNDTLRLNNFYVSDGIVQELIPSSISYGECTLSGNTLTINNTNTSTSVSLYLCYTILEF